MSNELLDHLRDTSKFSRSGSRPNRIHPYEFILRNGMTCNPRPFPADLEMGPMMKCYQNAYRIAVYRDDLTYVEGMAINIIPTAHAWLVDEHGNVVDPTWPHAMGEWHTGVPQQYVGIPFTRKWLMRRLLKQKHYGVLQDGIGYYADLIEGKVKPETFLDPKFKVGIPVDAP